MRKTLVCAGLVVASVLLCLWLGLIPMSAPRGGPSPRQAADDTSLEERTSESTADAETAAAGTRVRASDSEEPNRQPRADERALLAGHTLDSGDRPIPGVTVGLYEAEAQCGNSAYSFLIRRTFFPRAIGPLDDPTPAGLVRLGETVSDGDGYFEFRLHPSPGVYHFRCVGPERLSYCLGGPFALSDSPVRLRLQAAHELIGVVRDLESEAAVEGAVVDLIEEDPTTPRRDWGHMGERSRARRATDIDGLFRFELVPPGSYRLEVVHPDYERVDRQVVEVPVAAPPIVVSLARGGGGVVISGRVFDVATGFGIGGAEIEDSPGKHRVVSASSGEYRMHLAEEDVKYGRHFVVRASGYGIARKYVHGRVESQEWNIALHPARRLVCRVVATDERPVSAAKVLVRARLETPDGRSVSQETYSRVSDGDGLCTFTELPAVEDVEVFAFHPSTGSAYAGEVPLSETDEPAAVTLELVRGPVTVVATVRDLDGVPVAGAPVLLLQPRHELPDAVVRTWIVLRALGDFGDLRVAFTDTHGTATFPDTQPGECLAQAFGEGYLSEEIDGREDSVRSDVARFHAESDGETVCDLVLWSTFEVRGQVRTPEGDLLQGVLVSLLGWSDDRDWVLESPMAFSNEFGTYRFRGVSPVKRLAVAVRPIGLAGRQRQWEDWKKVATPGEREPAEQEYRTAQQFSVSPVVPTDLLFFSEIPAPSQAGESRVDIVVELPPR